MTESGKRVRQIVSGLAARLQDPLRLELITGRGLQSADGAAPSPLVDLPDDSDLKAAEAFYTRDQLADVGFVYREMLLMRGCVDVMTAQRDEWRAKMDEGRR